MEARTASKRLPERKMTSSVWIMSDDAVGIDAVILTKIDTDAKGGAALSIAHTIGKPIAFVCNGQEYDDIVKFNTEWMISRMFE